MYHTLFGDLEEKPTTIVRVELSNGLIYSEIRYKGKTIRGYSNKPSDEAIRRAGELLDLYAQQYVDSHNTYAS